MDISIIKQLRSAFFITLGGIYYKVRLDGNEQKVFVCTKNHENELAAASPKEAKWLLEQDEQHLAEHNIFIIKEQKAVKNERTRSKSK